jgi:hypothetical protein
VGEGLRRVRLGVLPGTAETLKYLPFWQMRAVVQGLRLDSYADLVRLMNLPMAVKTAWEETELSFWLPAFKVNPSLYLRLGRLLMVGQPSEIVDEAPIRAPCYTANVPLEDAREVLKVLIASVAVPRRQIFPRLSEISITVSDYRLVLVPVEQQGRELFQPQLQFSVSANALMHARFI